MQRVHDKSIDSSGVTPTTVDKKIIENGGGGATASMEVFNVASDNSTAEVQEPSIDTDKLSYEIFSILESKFLFGYDDPKLMVPRSLDPKTVYPVVAVDEGGGRVPGSIKNQRGKICILSIDGGGMRGILPGKALAYLEHALKSKSGDPNARISDYFDVAAGSGIGGIFTTMLFASSDGKRPVFRAEDTWKFVAQNAKSFYKPGPSSSRLLQRVMRTRSGSKSMSKPGVAKLEKAMKEAFTDLTLKDTLKPVLIPCYDLSSSAPFLFSRADALETDSYNFRLWEVCRATWAEPGAFEAMEMASVDGSTRCLAVDGGLAMSNPTAAAITHVLHNKQEFPFVRGVEDLLVLSLGTGQALEVTYDYEQVRRWRAKHWSRSMAHISADGTAETVDQAVAMAFGQSRSSNYVRIQANGSSFGPFRPDLDTDPSPSNVNMLVGVAEEMLKQKNVESILFGGKRIDGQSNFEKLDWLAGELVLEHQRRSCRITPTVAFKQSVHRTDQMMVNNTGGTARER